MHRLRTEIIIFTQKPAHIDATGGDVTALVYLSGHFNRNHLVVAEGYEITAADVEKFRMAGIILANSME